MSNKNRSPIELNPQKEKVKHNLTSTKPTTTISTETHISLRREIASVANGTELKAIAALKNTLQELKTQLEKMRLTS